MPTIIVVIIYFIHYQYCFYQYYYDWTRRRRLYANIQIDSTLNALIDHFKKKKHFAKSKV